MGRIQYSRLMTLEATEPIEANGRTKSIQAAHTCAVAAHTCACVGYFKVNSYGEVVYVFA